MVTTISASIGGVHGKATRRSLDMQEVWAGQLSIQGEVQRLPTKEEVSEPTQVPIDPPSQPEPEPVASQASVEAGSAEATICSIWVSVSCNYILRVARCESGEDYYAGLADYVGTFQLDPYLHGGRFLAHGWNIWTDGQDIYKNSVVAYELYLDSGMQPWPVCRYV